jgi:hypothetical protein
MRLAIIVGVRTITSYAPKTWKHLIFIIFLHALIYNLVLIYYYLRNLIYNKLTNKSIWILKILNKLKINIYGHWLSTLIIVTRAAAWTFHYAANDSIGFGTGVPLLRYFVAKLCFTYFIYINVMLTCTIHN